MRKRKQPIIEVGQKVRFDPFEDITGFGSSDNRGNYAIGTVVMVNKPHQWFSVEHGKLRTSFKFSQIGREVKVCGK